MSGLTDFLATHGAMLLAGTTCLLAMGAIAILFQRAPIHRQRTAESTVFAVLLWSVVACVPLPRFDLRTHWKATEHADPIHDAALGAEPSPEPTVSAAPITFPLPISESPTPEFDESVSPSFDESSVPLNELSLSVPTPTLPAVRSGVAATQEGDDETRQSPAVINVPMSTAIDWRHVAVSAYLLGAAACCGWLLIGRLLLWRLVRRSQAAPDWLAAEFATLTDRDAGRPVRLLWSDRCDRAMLFGLVRPTIVLPSGLCDPEAGELRHHVLLHELSHLRQLDQCGRWVFNLAFPALYLHPLFWWLWSTAGMSAELVADDWAAGHSSRETYADALLAVAKRRRWLPADGLPVFGVFRSPSQFYRRMTMLMQRKSPLATHCSTSWRFGYPIAALFTLGLLGATLGLSPALADKADEDAKVGQVEDRPNQASIQAEAAKLTARLQEQAEKVAKLASENAAKNRDEIERAAAEWREALIKSGVELSDEQAAKLQEQIVKRLIAEASRHRTQVDQLLAEHEGVYREYAKLRAQAAKLMIEQTAKLREQASKLSVGEAAKLRDQASKLLAVQNATSRDEIRLHAATIWKEELRKRGVKLPAEDAERIAATAEKHAAEHADEIRKHAAEHAAAARKQALEHAERAIPRSNRQKVIAEAARARQPRSPRQPAQATTAPIAQLAAGAQATKSIRGANAFLAAAGANGSSIDVLELANLYIDAQGTVETSRIDVKILSNRDVPGAEIQRAEATLRSADRKVSLFRKIAEVALSTAKTDLDTLTEQAEKAPNEGNAWNLKRQASQARQRIEILKLILSQ